jgi:hypothetical protein
VEEQPDKGGTVVPLYAAKIADLTHTDMITAICTCGHRAAIPVAVIKAKSKRSWLSR